MESDGRGWIKMRDPMCCLLYEEQHYSVQATRITHHTGIILIETHCDNPPEERPPEVEGVEALDGVELKWGREKARKVYQCVCFNARA